MGTPISVKPGVLGPVPDGSPVEVGSDSWGSLLTINKGPQYLEWTRRGYVFTGSVAPASPAAIPIYSTATNSPTLWNPSTSGKLIVPIRLNLNMGAFAGIVVGGFALAYLASAGDAVATAAPFSVFTNIAPINHLLRGATR